MLGAGMEQELHPVPSPALARGSGQVAGSFPELGINYRQRLPAKEVSGGSEQHAFPGPREPVFRGRQLA